MQSIMRLVLCVAQYTWLFVLLMGCSDLEFADSGLDDYVDDGGGLVGEGGETGVVTSVVDGDTIEVDVNGVLYRVRYVGVNTPERDEVCYSEARNANAALVEGRTVTLERDVSNTDRFGRLLRYVYADGRFVNAELIAAGWAENAEYNPDTSQSGYFRQLEDSARSAGAGCHPTGIFDDGDPRR